MSKISSVLSGVLHANNRLPSGDIANGRTSPVSNNVNALPVAAIASVQATANTMERRMDLMQRYLARRLRNPIARFPRSHAFPPLCVSERQDWA